MCRVFFAHGLMHALAALNLQVMDFNLALHVIDTDAFTSSPRPPGHVQLMPHSLELLSLPPESLSFAGRVVRRQSN